MGTTTYDIISPPTLMHFLQLPHIRAWELDKKGKSLAFIPTRKA